MSPHLAKRVLVASCLFGLTSLATAEQSDPPGVVCSAEVPIGDKDPPDLKEEARHLQESGINGYLRGLRNRDRLEVEAAVGELKKGLQIDPRMPNVYSMLNSYYLYGKLDARTALRVMNDGVKYNPKSPSIHLGLGITFSAMKRPREAISSFQTALDQGYACKDVAYFNIGNAYFDQQDWTQAIKYFEKALQIDPHYLKAHKNLIVAFYRAGNRPKAKAAATRLLELDPQGIYGAWAKEALSRLN